MEPMTVKSIKFIISQVMKSGDKRIDSRFASGKENPDNEPTYS